MTKKTHTSQPLTLPPEFTIMTAEENKKLLMTALADRDALQIDLSQISEIDGAGLQLLILIKKESYKHNIDLSFVGHSTVVMDVIDLCNLSTFFGDPLVITGDVKAGRD